MLQIREMIKLLLVVLQLSWTSGIYTDHTAVVLSLITLCLDNNDLQHEISNFVSDSQTPVLALKTLLDIVYRSVL